MGTRILELKTFALSHSQRFLHRLGWHHQPTGLLPALARQRYRGNVAV